MRTLAIARATVIRSSTLMRRESGVNMSAMRWTLESSRDALGHCHRLHIVKRVTVVEGGLPRRVVPVVTKGGHNDKYC
jgi:hypothetical protein